MGVRVVAEMEEGLQAPLADKRMRLRYAGTCRLCGAPLPARTEAIWERTSKTVRCVTCPSPTETAAEATSWPPPVATDRVTAGVAGSSARREYERRHAKDDERLRAKWGRFGGIAVSLSDERQSTTAWRRGAHGEERLGARLDSLAGEGVAVLHDRRIPGSRANIDHIAITRSGIWVIDAKRYAGRPRLVIEGGIFKPGVEKLVVGRRDCTKLVDSALRQAAVVQELLGAVPVTGALCFVDADWPLIGGAVVTRGIHVLWPKRLAKLLTKAPAGDVDVAAMRTFLGARFKPA